MFDQIWSMLANVVIGVAVLIIAVSHVLTWHSSFEAQLNRRAVSDNQSVYTVERQEGNVTIDNALERPVISHLMQLGLLSEDENYTLSTDGNTMDLSKRAIIYCLKNDGQVVGTAQVMQWLEANKLNVEQIYERDNNIIVEVTYDW